MNRLNYHHLYYFWRVAKQGNLTATAEKLAISQSALSAQINQLEHSIGQPLFAREGRQLVLTELGHTVLNYAEDIFQRGEELQQLLKRGVITLPSLRIGMLSSMSRNFIESFIEPLLRASHADASFRLLARPQPELLDLLAQHQIDVVLTNLPPARGPSGRFLVYHLAQQQVHLLGTLGLARPGAEPVALLGRAPLVVPTPETAIRGALDGLVARLGITPVIAAEVDDMAMMRLLAREGVGLAVVPPIVARDELASGRLTDAGPLPGISESFYAVTPERRFPNPLLAELLADRRAEAAVAGPAENVVV